MCIRDSPSTVLLGCLALAWLAAVPSALLGIFKGLQGMLHWDREPEAQRNAAKQLELVPLVLFAPLAALAFGLSDLKIDRWPVPLQVAGFRYFLPIFLTGTLLLAALVGRTQRLRFRLPWATVAVATMACLTGLWNLRYLDLANPQPTLGTKYSGYNFVQAARGLGGARNQLDRGQRSAYADSFPSFFRGQLYRGLGYHGAQKQLILAQQRSDKQRLLDWIAASTLDLDALTLDYPSDMHANMARGAGEGLRSLAQSGKNGFVAMAPHLARLLETGHPLAPLVIEGCAIQEDFPHTTKRAAFFLGRNVGLMDHIDAKVRPHLARGIGRYCGILLARDVPGFSATVLVYLNNLGTKHRAAIDSGIVQGLVEGSQDPSWHPALAKLVPQGRGEQLKADFTAALAP